MITCEKCGKVYHSDVTPLYCRCGGVGGLVQPVKQESTVWVRYIKMLRVPADKGVGDTVARILANIGGERFKTLSKQIGIPCGCADRQAEWNRLWPY